MAWIPPEQKFFNSPVTCFCQTKTSFLTSQVVFDLPFSRQTAPNLPKCCFLLVFSAKHERMEVLDKYFFHEGMLRVFL